MRDKEEILATIQHFIREGTMQYMKGKVSEPLILMEDFDKDGEKELVAIYKEGSHNKLVSIKKNKGKWMNAWYRKLPDERIEEIDAIEGYLIIFTKQGFKRGCQFFQWTDSGMTNIQQINHQYHKMVSVHHRNYNFMIAWRHKGEAQWDIDIYEINNKGIVQVKEEDKIYLVYLKCYQDKVREKEILRAQTITLWGEQTQVYLLGKRYENQIEELEMIIGATTQTEEVRWQMGDRVIKSYEWIVGYFEEPTHEQVYLSIEDANQEGKRTAWLWQMTLKGVIDLFEDIVKHQREFIEVRWHVMMLHIDGPLCLVGLEEVGQLTQERNCRIYALKEGQLQQSKVLKIREVNEIS